LLRAPCEAWWDIYGVPELSLGNIEGSISRDGVVEGFEKGDGRIAVA